MHQYLKRGFVELVFQVIYVEVGMSICACYHLKCISHSVSKSKTSAKVPRLYYYIQRPESEQTGRE